MNNFDLRKFLTENKLTSNSKVLNESKDYVSFAMQNIGDVSTPVLLTHGFNRYEEKKYKTTLGKALAFIKKNAEKSAIEHGDVTVDGGRGLVRITIGDQEFDIKDMDEKNGKSLTEAMTVVGNTPEETEKNAEEIVALANKLGIKATIERRADGSIYGVDIQGRGHKQLDALQKRQLDAFQQKEPVTVKPGQKLKKLTVGGKTYELGDFDPNDDGRIESIEKYSNGYAITGGVYADYGDGDDPKEMYSYAIDLKGNEMDEEDLQGRD